MLSRDELRNRRLCAMTKDPKDLHRNRSWWFVHDLLTRLYVCPTRRSNSDWAKLTFLYLFLSRDGVRVCWANISNYWWIKRKKKADCGGCTSGFSPIFFFFSSGSNSSGGEKFSEGQPNLESRCFGWEIDDCQSNLNLSTRCLKLSLNVRIDVNAISHVCVHVCEWFFSTFSFGLDNSF